MPATYTHHIFTKDVYKVLDDNIKNKMNDNKDLFYLFGKSFDILFFVNKRLGGYAHNNKVNLYFANMINYIRDNNLYDDNEVLAYLYGSICHYILDSTIHPYVFYKTGRYDYKDKKTRKYKGLHNKFEYMIDAIIYEERNNKKIYKANLKKEVFAKIKFSNQLDDMIDDVYLNTFNVNNGHKMIKKGIRNYHFALGHGMSSRWGIKYYIYKFLDLFNISKKMYFKDACYHIKKLDYTVLNNEHKKWYYPVDKKISYHYSLYDLYDVAIEKARTIINHLDSALDKDEKEIKKVLREIGNLSYSTGKNADKHYTMKYFEI